MRNFCFGPLLKIPGLLLVIGFLGSCTKESDEQDDIYNSRGIAAVANNNFNLTTFGSALQVTGHTTLLTTAGPFTVFAPSNTAFTAFGYTSVAAVKNNPAALQRVIPYHIYMGLLNLDSLPYAFNQPVKMKDGLPIHLSRSKNDRDSVITINGVRAERSKFEASNGYVYVLEKVLEPTVEFSVKTLVANARNLTFFNAALERSGLGNDLNSAPEFTLFAPENAAFNAIGIPSTDSIYKMSPADLAQLIIPHITKGRQYVYDYIMKADVASNSYAETMLDSEPAQIKLLPDFSRPGRFRGISIEKSDAQGTVITGNLITQDISARNGVLHIINRVLIP